MFFMVVLVTLALKCIFIIYIIIHLYYVLYIFIILFIYEILYNLYCKIIFRNEKKFFVFKCKKINIQ